MSDSIRVGGNTQVFQYDQPTKVVDVAGAKSKATTTNPKDLMGDKKVDFNQVSPFAIAHEACAMMDGTWKYGYRNWRDKEVRARIYIAACKRHLAAWEEGEETADDSFVHHLGHARACLGILLDAQETGNLIDDRVKSNGKLGALLDRLSNWVVTHRKFHEQQKANADRNAHSVLQN